jgi:hypothetical protein
MAAKGCRPRPVGRNVSNRGGRHSGGQRSPYKRSPLRGPLGGIHHALQRQSLPRRGLWMRGDSNTKIGSGNPVKEIDVNGYKVDAFTYKVDAFTVLYK